jgi:hypothetical protein
MSGTIIPAAPTSTIITVEYNDAVWGEPGLAWAILHDNQPIGWNVGGATAQPVVLGTMPAAPPDTGAILSPLWGQVIFTGTMLLPDMFRGTPEECFTFLATNNGARRQLYANFASSALAMAWSQWAANNPTLALKEPPNLGTPPAPEEPPPDPPPPPEPGEEMAPLLPTRAHHRAHQPPAREA